MTHASSLPENRPLTVLHISTYDNYGGSAKSAYKIHTGLREMGVRSRMLVKRNFTTDTDVGVVAKGMAKGLDAAVGQGLDALGLQYIFYPSSRAILRHPWFLEADIVQLYNTHSGYFTHSVLPAMSRRKRLVWRLSDMWPMTGHCAYSGPCDRWKTGCGKCPDLVTPPSLPRDTTALLWRHKRWLYGRSDFHVVAPSRWIEGVAAQSPLLGKFPRSYIPNGINTRVFRPLEKALCRNILGIPEGRLAVLFIANTLTDPKKGGVHFLRAMNLLEDAEPGKYMALAVGERAMGWGTELRCPAWKHDLVLEDELLALAYNAADVYVHAAPRENFPNTILEAMACSSPVVGFDSGGVREVLVHGRTGHLAAEETAEELARGVRACLRDEGERERLSRNCREAVLESFSLERQARDFRDLYRGLLAAPAPGV